MLLQLVLLVKENNSLNYFGKIGDMKWADGEAAGIAGIAQERQRMIVTRSIFGSYSEMGC